MRTNTPPAEPALPPDRLDAARMEAQAQKQTLPRGLQFALVVAVIAGAAGFAFFAVREPSHPDGPGMSVGFIVVAISTLIAMGAAYAVFDLVRAIGFVLGGDGKSQPVIHERIDAIGHERSQGSPTAGFIKLILFAVCLWLVYLLIKAMYLSGP